jgi:epoxyqueuosine reductase
VILTSLDLSPTLGPAESPAPDLCGSCTRCIDACPTGALVEPYVMDARLCISYLTIELRGTIPEALREPMGSHVFGCDICQDVCPWNRRAPVTQAPEFQPRIIPRSTISQPEETPSSIAVRANEESLFLPRLEWLALMNEAEFRAVFRGSPVKRTKWRGLVRNACVALGNSVPPRGSHHHERISALLTRLSASADPLIAESAQWALSRIQ